MHELMHGLGPHQITVGGHGRRPCGAQLKETYSAIEEAKADISGLFALQYLIDKGVLDKAMRGRRCTTRSWRRRSARSGSASTRRTAGALRIQLNWLLDSGAFTVDTDGTFAVDPAKIKDGVTALTREIMTLQAEGDYAKAKEMLARLAVVRPEVQKVLDRLQGGAGRHRAAVHDGGEAAGGGQQ